MSAAATSSGYKRALLAPLSRRSPMSRGAALVVRAEQGPGDSNPSTKGGVPTKLSEEQIREVGAFYTACPSGVCTGYTCRGACSTAMPRASLHSSNCITMATAMLLLHAPVDMPSCHHHPPFLRQPVEAGPSASTTHVTSFLHCQALPDANHL